MRSFLALTIIVSSSTAAAEAVVEGDVSAGTSAQGEFDASSARAGTSFALASAHGAARIERTQPIDQRGLHMCSLDGEGCLWVFTSIVPEERDGAGVEASSRMAYATTNDTANDIALDARAWARAAGWGLEARTAYQPETTLRDRFWRSNRGVAQTNLALSIPSMWSLGTYQTQLSVMSGVVDFGSRKQRIDDTWEAIGFDRDIAIRGATVYSQWLTVDVFDFRMTELGVADREVAGTTYGTEVASLDIDIVGAELRLPHAIALEGRVGFADRTPLAPFMSTSSSTRVNGPFIFLPSYSVEARLGALDDATRSLALTLGGGTWLRLDPSGHAVDAGHLASTAALVRRGKLTLRLDGQLGKLRRMLVGGLAPIEVARSGGTDMVMGRGSLQASYAITNALAITSNAWVEHSDRPDPRWEASHEPATHAGGDIAAVWSFRKQR